jgi:transposase
VKPPESRQRSGNRLPTVADQVTIRPIFALKPLIADVAAKIRRVLAGIPLVVPKNLSLVILPSGFPELNPVENIGQHLRANWLSNRVFGT